jgi:hypothetical protein
LEGRVSEQERAIATLKVCAQLTDRLRLSTAFRRVPREAALTFHKRCNGHANALTLISDTDGNVFGGFTPLEWDSEPTRDAKYKSDDSQSLIFRLKNSHNTPPRNSR